MPTNGKSLSHTQGIGGISFTFPPARPIKPFNLEPASYVVTISQVDIHNPGVLTLTDANGDAHVFDGGHGHFALLVERRDQSPWELSVAGQIDFISVQQGHVRPTAPTYNLVPR